MFPVFPLTVGTLFARGGLARDLRSVITSLDCCQIVRGTPMSDQTKLSTEEFTSAVESLMQLIPDEELDRLQPSHPVTVYTTLVTLWMMIMQRLGEGKTLAATVKNVLATNRATNASARGRSRKRRAPIREPASVSI